MYNTNNANWIIPIDVFCFPIYYYCSQYCTLVIIVCCNQVSLQNIKTQNNIYKTNVCVSSELLYMNSMFTLFVWKYKQCKAWLRKGASVVYRTAEEPGPSSQHHIIIIVTSRALISETERLGWAFLQTVSLSAPTCLVQSEKRRKLR